MKLEPDFENSFRPSGMKNSMLDSEDFFRQLDKVFIKVWTNLMNLFILQIRSFTKD